MNKALVNAEMMEDALNRVQGFIDKNAKDIGKGPISTYIHEDELGAMIFIVKSILSDYPLARPYELYKNKYACKFRQDGVHLGFMLNTSSYDNLGFDYEGQNYVSAFTFEADESIFVNEREFERYMNYSTPSQRHSSHPYILFFKGCDDCSYGLRFENVLVREQFINDHPVFTEFIRTKCLSYN